MQGATFNDLFAFLTQLMTEHAALFQATGEHMFHGFAVIAVIWFGLKSALAATSGVGFRFDQCVALILTLAFGQAMIFYYDQPIPGVGISFDHLFIDEGTYLANQLDHALADEIDTHLNNLYDSVGSVSLLAVLHPIDLIRYGLTIIAIAVAEACVFAVIGFGYVAATVAVLVGPIFIPFVIVPDFDWIFWGWLRSLLQYSFYPVIAQAYLFAFGSLLIRFFDAHPAPYDGAGVAALFLPLVVLLISFTYGILKIPSLVNSLFTGRSGESAVPRF